MIKNKIFYKIIISTIIIFSKNIIHAANVTYDPMVIKRYQDKKNQLLLTAIVITHSGKKFCIINNQLLHIGDKIDIYTIEDITGEKILLKVKDDDNMEIIEPLYFNR